VEAALRRAVALWGRLAPSEYPNGALVFCSEGLAEAVHPPQPLQRRVYSCGRGFDTTVLREQLDAQRAPAYGLLVVDGSDAAIGTARGLGADGGPSGCPVVQLARLSSGTASRTRRGGQSALRYSRLRDEADLAFLRRVAERAAALLGEAHGVVLAGKADAKRRLLPELPPGLRAKVLCLVDLPCGADAEGLRQAALRARAAASSDRSREAEGAVARFLELLVLPGDASGALHCYGARQTAAALRMGAVDTLLVAAGAAEAAGGGGATAGGDLRALADIHGTAVVEVSDRTEQGAQFCRAFGVGACLRWPVDPELLEEPQGLQEAEEVAAADGSGPEVPTIADDAPRSAAEEPAGSSARCGEEALGAAQLGMVQPSGEAPAAGTAATAADEAVPPQAATASSALLAWLAEALKESLGDPSTAEALTACAEVLLTDDSVPAQEAVAQAGELLLAEGVPRGIVEELSVRAA